MNEPERKNDGNPLEATFAAARAARGAEVPDALLARVLEDAAANMPRPAGRRAGGNARPGLARLREVLGALGGWPALGGLTAAAAAGFWLGFAPPAPVATAISTWSGAADAEDVTAFLPDYGTLTLQDG